MEEITVPPDLPESKDATRSLNVYPFANILRDSWWRRTWRFIRNANWPMISALVFCVAVESAAAWLIYRAFVGW